MEDLDLDLDLPSSSFMITMFGVFSIGSTDLRFWQIALDLVCRSKSSSSLFSIRSDRLLQPMRVFRRDVYDTVSSDAACRFFILVFGFLFYGLGHWAKDVNNTFGFQSRGEWLGCGCFCSCLKNGFLCHWKEFMFYKLKIEL
jgi:hypothetical protein